MKNYRHYTYIISNTKENKHYIGTRTCPKRLTPETDLGFKYFSSAKTNSWIIQDQKDNPQDYTYQVINRFQLRKEAVWHEICLHKIFNVGINPDFYNGARQTSARFSFDRTGAAHSDETKRKISEASKNISDSVRKKMSLANSGKNNSMFGKVHSEVAKQKISESKSGKPLSNKHVAKIVKANTGKRQSNETKQKISESNIGKTRSAETKQKISEAKMNRIASDETKAKMSESRTGKIWIHNVSENLSTLIKVSDFQEYEKIGWIKGRK